jgi:hypothetical protein
MGHLTSDVRECARCGGPQRQEQVEVTAFGDPAPRFMPGMWERCARCGWAGVPVLVLNAPTMSTVELGPRVPTPEELMQAYWEWRFGL